MEVNIHALRLNTQTRDREKQRERERVRDCFKKETLMIFYDTIWDTPLLNSVPLQCVQFGRNIFAN